MLEVDAGTASLTLTRYDWIGAGFAVKEAKRFARGPAGWDEAPHS